MYDLTPESRRLVDQVAARHAIEPDAVAAALQALIAGGGLMAQFSHPAFGGMAQWQAGGPSMAGSLFEDGPARTLEAVCEDLAAALPHLAPGELARSGWPAEFGEPSAAGGQDGLRYAVFPATRRLVVEHGSTRVVYDTGEAAITGIAQHQGGAAGLVLDTREGPIELARLRRIEPDGAALRIGSMEDDPPLHGRLEPDRRVTGHELAVAREQAVEPAPLRSLSRPPLAEPAREGERDPGHDVAERIELLGRLRLKGLVTDAEFASKKAELLARL